MILAPFLCVVDHLRDGDTWECTSGVVVRPARIDTPEMPGHCRRNRHCVPGDPYAAKQALSDLILGKTLECVPVSASPRGGSPIDRYGRIVARCSVNGVDVGGYMLLHGAVGWPHD